MGSLELSASSSPPPHSSPRRWASVFVSHQASSLRHKEIASDLLEYWKKVAIEESEQNGSPQNVKSNNTVVKVEKADLVNAENVSALPKGSVNKSDMDVNIMKCQHCQGIKIENIFGNASKDQSV